MHTLKTNRNHSARVYLLNPMSPGRFHESIQKNGMPDGSPMRQRNHSGAIINTNQAPTRFLIHTRDDTKVILFDDVMYCVADSNYTKIYLRDGSMHMVCKTLKAIAAILCQPNFLRIHASNLINLNFVKRILKTQGYTVELPNHVVLDVSRSRRDELMQKIVTL